MSNPDQRPRAILFGCAGTKLSGQERDLFNRAQPLGFILFGRNCQTPAQLLGLVAELRAAIGRPEAPVLIDQEGGRVARLRPPQWRANPAAANFGVLAESNIDQAIEAAYINARLCAAELIGAGIDVNCTPVLDLARPETTAAIGNRAYAGNPEIVARLGRAVCDGHLTGGVLPVIKHLPGHGLATVDSHHELPIVKASHADLAAEDFQPFKALAAQPLAMTCHLLFPALDPENPATQSKSIIADRIRGEIGFDGFLLSDDISMQALGGDIASRTAKALNAGCDAVLHCTGLFHEMEILSESVPPMTNASLARFNAAQGARQEPDRIDAEALEAHLAELLAS
ncbi:MAG: beta-N-acetylhexosaminidase [Alphaproteobacteria bacterium]